MSQTANNVAVVPIQLSHLDAPGRKVASPPVEIDFPEVDFEDCSSFVDFAFLRESSQRSHGAFQNGIHDINGNDHAWNGDKSDIEFVEHFHAGKRKAAPADVSSKRQKTNYVTVAKTVCRYRIVAHLDESRGDLDELRRRKPGTKIAEVDSFSVLDLLERDEDSWIQKALQLHDSEGKVFAALPIVDTGRIPFARSPHRFTNGAWLQSMVTLCGGVLGGAEGELLKVNASLALGEKLSSATQLCIDLHIEVQLPLDVFNPGQQQQSSPFVATHLHQLMRFCFPNDGDERQIRSCKEVSSSSIYSLLPSSKLPPQEDVQPYLLCPSLFPFQRRSVNFLLGREGKQLAGKRENGERSVEDIQGVMTHRGVQQLGLFWRKLDDDLYYNPVSGRLTRSAQQTQSDGVSGGILAEEMGLGKTVEVLALILLNPGEFRSFQPSYYNEEQEVDVSPTKTTLIVAPETLRQQWLDEISLHAPDLMTFSYLGYRDASRHIPPGMEWRDYSKKFDIIVVSFDTLRREINVARKAPARSRRHERKYERPRSLLIQLSFHRVIMDEVQLVGHGGAAETVSMIDRHHSLAVSGTPVKVLSDLRSLFHFLRILTPANGKHWDRLQTPALLPSLADCFSMLATRHTKQQVQSEMVLPPQTRVLVPVTFTAIEAAFYRDIYSRSLQALGIDDPSRFANDRALLEERFREDMHQLQNTLVSLRQACTHPQIAGSHWQGGQHLGRAALTTSNTIRSMDEVLTIMIEGTKADQGNIWQQLLRKQVNRAVLLLQDKTNKARLDIAKEMLSATIPIVKERIDAAIEDSKKAKWIGPLYRFDRNEVESNERAASVPSMEDAEQPVPLLNGTSTAITQLEREKEHDLAERKINRSRHINALDARWRSFMEQLHRAHHFLGNTYFQMGEARKIEEAQLIQQAEGQNHDQHFSEKVMENGPSSSAEAVTNVEEEDELRDGAEEEECKRSKGKVISNGGSAVSAEVAALKKLENDAYDAAEEVRQRLLKGARRVVERSLHVLDTSQQGLILDDIVSDVDFGRSGIASVLSFDKLDDAQDLLNRQAEMLLRWRGEILERLRKPVSRDVSDEDENDDQYQENLDAQAEAEALTEMYRVMLNERESLVTGVRIEGSTSKPALYVELERHFLTKKTLESLQVTNPEHESVLRYMENAPTVEQEDAMKLQLNHFEKLTNERREALFGGDVNARKQVEGESEEGDSEEDEIEDSDEDVEVEHIVNSAPSGRRHNQKIEDERLDAGQALEPILREMREVMQNRSRPEEVAILRMAIEKARALISSQKAMCEKLKKEHNLFMVVFNARSAYFRHIQELSDSVGDIVTGNIAKEMASIDQDEAVLKGRAEVVAGRLRYLSAIEEEEGAGLEQGTKTEGSARTCFICTEPLVKAVIFNTCGHSTCESCFKSWTARRGQCPMCKTKVTPKDVYRVTYGPDGKGKRRQVQIPQAEKQKRQHARFNVLSEDMTRSLSVMPIRSALGSKLDLLTRHLMYIEHTKPTTKSLIFTAFSRGIKLVGDALRMNNIKYVTLDQGGAKASRIIDTFKNDQSVNVLLLHSEAQSSGLNLNVCENVLLLEPLVNHSIELQAIGRVHRIGQTKETTIFLYQVNDTVEEKIVQLAADRGQSLVTQENCRLQDLKDSAEMIAKTQQDRGRAAQRVKEGEFVASYDELVRCLFDEESNNSEGGKNGEEERDSSSSPVKREEDERERMRQERLYAIERRRAMASLDQEGDRLPGGSASGF